MMIVILFRILLLAAFTLLIYTLITYLNHPQRQLKIAKSQQDFYLIDDTTDSKSIQFVYKGCLFTGKKHLGMAGDAFEVVDVFISVPNPMELKGIKREDLYFLEKEILIRYPYANIRWEPPIDQLLLTKEE